MFKFDWYAATVREERVSGPRGDTLVMELEDEFTARAEEAPALHGYGSAVVLRRSDGDSVARVMHGGKQPWPLVVGSGVHTPGVARGLRARFPRHYVTRADSAADYDAPGAWDRLHQTALTFADDRDLKVGQAGDWHRGKDGRTLYVGSMSSAVFLRVYEKGLEQRSKGIADASPDWVRVELSVKPLKDSRMVAASVTPSELWGFSRWSRDLLREIEGLDVPPHTMQQHRESDHAQAMRNLVQQYRATLAREFVRLGSWEAVGAALGARVEESS